MRGGAGMNDIFREINDLTAEMDKLQKFDDDVFIRFYEKVDELQEQLDDMEKADTLSHEQKEEYSKKLSEAFEKMRGKMSFCTLS